MPEISVIVLNWNGKHFLDACLAALRGQTYKDFETIFVDNGSKDGSSDFVRKSFPEVRTIVLENNLGFVGGNLEGYKQARGEWIVLLNNDTEADPRWLEELHCAIHDFPETCVFASKMLLFHQRSRIDNCGFDMACMGLTIDLGRDQKDGPEWQKPRKVFGGCGGAVAYRRSMIEDVGFLDPDFFMTFEDVDLSFRAQLRGYECIFVPGAIVYHHYRGTMTKYPARQVYLSQRNIEFVYLKNMPFALILRYLPQRILYELGGIIYFTRMGVGGSFLKAKFDSIRQLPLVLRKRRAIQNRRTISNAQLRALLRGNSIGTKWRKFCAVWQKPTTPKAADSQAAD